MHEFDLLTTAEAAERIGVERSTLTRWVQLGKLEVAHRLPGKTGSMLFRAEDIDRAKAELLPDPQPQEAQAS